LETSWNLRLDAYPIRPIGKFLEPHEQILPLVHISTSESVARK
jgi:hypothetical protein